jgi:hypothetical protein
VAGNVEVVGNVLPAFVAHDSLLLVYEAYREVHVYSLRDHSNRKLGNGIAPRILPFSSDVIFLREVQENRRATPQDIPYRYHVIRVPVAGGQETLLGEIKVSVRNDDHGNYSPVRMLRVLEQDGQFYLVGERVDKFQLPSPFGG